MNPVINFLAFQTVWLTTVLGIANGLPWLGFLALLIFLAIKLTKAESKKSEITIIVCAILIGFTLETLFIRSEAIIYAQHGPWGVIAPPWILILWINLSLTLNSCLKWLQNHLRLSALLGAIAGPLTYYAGSRLGAGQIGPDAIIGIAILAVSWALATPLLLGIARANETTDQTG